MRGVNEPRLLFFPQISFQSRPYHTPVTTKCIKKYSYKIHTYLQYTMNSLGIDMKHKP